jgi:hypothetical protein
MKSILLSVFAISALTLVSCKKQYTCECKHEIYQGKAALVNTTTNIKYIKAKSESSAAATCVANNSEEIDVDGFGHKTICDLK